jgi:hypothetical protein
MAKPSFPPPALKQKKTLLSVFFVLLSGARRYGLAIPIQFYSFISLKRVLCTFATLKYQMLGSEMSMQALTLRSPDAFVNL